jgi:hypothetical protein
MMQQKYFKEPFAAAGDKTPVPDDLQPSGNVSFNQGWGYDYQRNPQSDPLAKPVDRMEMNYLFAAVTENIKQFQENAFPEFITTEDNGGSPFIYDKYAMVKWRAENADAPGLFVSLIANTSTTPDATNAWLPFDEFIASLVPESGLHIPIEIALESDLPTEGQQDGDYYVIQEMDVTAPGHTGRAWWNNGDWGRIYDKTISADKLLPVGAEIFWTGTTAPNGFLEENGALLSRAAYADLWAHAQASGNIVTDAEWSDNNWGAFSDGDGSTTFRLPDAPSPASRHAPACKQRIGACPRI